MKYAFKPWDLLLNKSTFTRLFLGTIIGVAIGIIYIYIFQYMGGGIWGDTAKSTGTFVLLHILAFNWLYWWTLSMDNWPFSLFLPQPWQGLAVGISGVLMGCLTLWVMKDVLGMAAQIFPFGVWWLFFVFGMPAWMGDLFRNAYEGKQPITGISIQIASIGLGAVGWWMTLNATLEGVFSPGAVATTSTFLGMPFVWFCAAVTFSFCMGNWPFAVNQPAQFVLQLGYYAFYSLVYLWVMGITNCSFFTGPPLHGAVYSILWLLPALYWIGLGHAWPFHAVAPWLKGIIVIGGSMIFGVIVLKYVVLAQSPNYTTGEHALYMTSALNWVLGIFVGWAFTWTNMGWLYLPAPGAAQE